MTGIMPAKMANVPDEIADLTFRLAAIAMTTGM